MKEKNAPMAVIFMQPRRARLHGETCTGPVPGSTSHGDDGDGTEAFKL